MDHFIDDQTKLTKVFCVLEMIIDCHCDILVRDNSCHLVKYLVKSQWMTKQITIMALNLKLTLMPKLKVENFAYLKSSSLADAGFSVKTTQPFFFWFTLWWTGFLIRLLLIYLNFAQIFFSRSFDKSRWNIRW